MSGKKNPSISDERTVRMPLFAPLPDGRPERNLIEFIRLAQHDLTVLGEHLDWSGWRWKGVGMFLKLGIPNLVGDPANWHMRPEFVDFAKAYVRYQIGHNPSVRLGKRLLIALRLVEESLIRLTGMANPIDIDLRVLNKAAQIGRQHYKVSGAYQAGRNLEVLAKFLSRNGLTRNDTVTWCNSNPAAMHLTTAVGEEAESHRRAKLPDQRAINAIGQVFAAGFELADNRTHSDVYVTSLGGMLMAAPCRIGELHELRDDLEIEEPDSSGELQYGWKFRAYKNKSNAWRIKWIPADWVPIAKEAIRRIREITEQPRAFARYVESQLAMRARNPAAPLLFYRHFTCPDVADDHPLSAEEVAAALGIQSVDPGSCLRARGLTAKRGAHTLNSLWLWVLEQLPGSFPYVAGAKNKRLKYSEALFCMHRNQMKRGILANPVSVWIPTQSTFAPLLSGSEEHVKGFFESHGFTDGDGRPLRANSHQIRHLLNTIAHEGTGESYLGAEAINFWSGRDKMWQGETYDHEPLENKVRRATNALRQKDGSFAVIDITPELAIRGTNDSPSLHWQVMRPVPTSCANTELVHRSPVLWTFYGGCEHDWLLEPCQHYKDCLNCKDYVCIKGIGADDIERLDRLRKLLPHVIEQQGRAKALAERGDPGTQDWYEQQTAYRQRIEQLIGLLDNLDVPVGTKIRLANSTANSHLHRVLKKVALQSLESGAEKQSVIDAIMLAFSRNKGLPLCGDDELTEQKKENNG